MTLEVALDYLGALSLVAGAVFCLAAALGLVRFPDPLTRMHAATKPSVFGLLLVLLGVTLTLRDPKVFTLLTFAVLMQVMTAPVSGHLVSRTSHRTGQWDAEHAVIDELAADQADASEPSAPPNVP
ncbi:MAG TPA: monovalent cation/H(+) antiporter subunit G [Propionicimonas sp.]|nr:monovalent cation/H(+) antiporter subunit G [Propionicimonas sp.]HRA05451.1 monovalent cation/H(+) antiporter subunit G [Propionicimonas sp.]